jgi:tRNA wybutosine-synthesizing protein 3
VFVEGPKKSLPIQEGSNAAKTKQQVEIFDASKDTKVIADATNQPSYGNNDDHYESASKTAPGGKGGGHWLYVSHDPLTTPVCEASEPNCWTRLFNVSDSVTTHDAGTSAMAEAADVRRLIHLQYSPLILHVLCATLQHARPLLSAAINAGFRESGVHSLKSLAPEHVGEGVMVAIRTNGITFSSVIGLLNDLSDTMTRGATNTQHGPRFERIVPESYLAMCAGVINERFAWNEVRKQRLVKEITAALTREPCLWGGNSISTDPTALDGSTALLDTSRIEHYESKSERRDRKRREGLARQQEVKLWRQEGPQETEAASMGYLDNDNASGESDTIS